MPYGIELAQAAGGQTAGNFINEGMGLLFAGPKRKAQMKTATQMQDLQMKGNKEMTDYNMKKQLEMWEATGYGAQVDQMKRAGINPALLYGMGSGGGQTANIQSGNVSGQHAGPPEASRGSEGMGMMIGQMGLLKAQKENIEADTANKKAQTEKTSGVDTALAGAQEKHTNLMNEWQGVQNAIARMTMKEAMTTIENQAAKSQEELEIMARNNQLDAAQYKDKIKQLKTHIIEAGVRMAMMEAQKSNINQDTKNKIQEILESEQRIKSMSQTLAIAWDKWSQEYSMNERERLDKIADETGFEFLKDLPLPTIFAPLGNIKSTPNKIGYK